MPSNYFECINSSSSDLFHSSAEFSFHMFYQEISQKEDLVAYHCMISDSSLCGGGLVSILMLNVGLVSILMLNDEGWCQF